jgi:hypothetical protein
MLRRVALVRTDVSEELSASFIKVTRIGEPGTTLAVTSNRHTQRRNTKISACILLRCNSRWQSKDYTWTSTLKGIIIVLNTIRLCLLSSASLIPYFPCFPVLIKELYSPKQFIHLSYTTLQTNTLYSSCSPYQTVIIQNVPGNNIVSVGGHIISHLMKICASTFFIHNHILFSICTLHSQNV